ncbi:MAG: glycerol-3-phosphate 1-O-acyltransferase PlsY [Elusimicrobia bacterium]|nr:glycerol-3-phosphate 1-O-acyltransferase PlsY [Elusimicrobiota bacterium]
MEKDLIPKLIFAYFWGSIPFGWIYVKIFLGRDIRNFGSGNIGATNVYRVCGIFAAVLIFLLDFFKGFVPVYFFSPVVFQKILLGLAAISGHAFSFFLKGRGGKGVATSAGAAVALAPLPVGISLAVFLLVFSVSRIVSVSSLLAALCLPLLVLLFKGGKQIFWFSVAAVCFIFFAHRKNIARLLRGEEKRVSKIG